MRTAALVLVALTACSGGGNGVPDPPPAGCTPGAVLACPGGWATCSAAGELGGCVVTAPPTDAAAPEPVLDAAPPACTAPPVSTQALGVRCVVLEDACTCSSGVRYRCTAPDYRSQPSTAVVLGGAGIPGGCVTLLDVFTTTTEGVVTYTTEHCCASACVRSAASDGVCSSSHPNAYQCATDASPRPDCVRVGAVACCD